MALINNPGSGGNTNFTDGSIPYSSGGILTENNSNFRWDNATTTLFVNGVSFTPGKYSASTGASFVGFTQSGTGAITTETVQAALRRMVFSGQYSTAGNFNTAQAALTDTLGIKSLRIGSGTGSGSGIVLPTASANGNHYIYLQDTTFNGVVDPILVYGYNPGRPNTSEPSLYDSTEGHYFDNVTHYMEKNLDYVSADGGTSKRFFGMNLNRATHLATWQWAGSAFAFRAIFDSTASLTFSATGVGIGAEVTAGSRVLIAGTQNSGSSEFGINYTGTAGSGVTNTLACFLTQPATAAAAFTCSRLQHFAVVDAALGAGSAITEQDGFRCTDLTTGGINIAFKGEVTSGSNKWNLSMTGTAQNFLQGVTGIGIAASATTALAVAAGTTGVSPFRIPHGAAPTAPVDGDTWTTTAGLFIRINGVTKTVTLT